MKNAIFKSCLVFTFCFVVLIALECDALENNIKRLGNQSTISIQSDYLEADTKKRIIEFYGNVKARSEEFELNCQRLWIYPKAKREKDDKGWEIEKLIAKGNVMVKRVSGETVEAQEAIYYPEADRIELSGSPVLTRGGDSVRGQRMEINLRENKIRVLSGGEEKVTAVVRSLSKPKDEKGGNQ